MKRIIICLNDFKHGGIPRCLHSLLTFIDSDKYIVDVVCLDSEGPYLKEIEEILKQKAGKIITFGTFFRYICTFSSNIKDKKIFDRIAIIICKAIWKVILKIFKKDLLKICLKRKAKELSDIYDIGISYAEGNCSLLISEISCKNKLIYIHNDYEYTTDAGIGTDFHLFNKICCVSEATKKSFTQHYPELKKKCVTIYNTINYQLIKRLAKEPIDNHLFNNKTYTIISIGRVSYQKQFTKIPSIASQLKKVGVQFIWYIIGDGPEMQKLKKEIVRLNVDNEVILLGKQENPYKYLAKANLYALTSVYESYPTVINEAIVLNIPIISTNIPPAYEMLDEKTGNIAQIDDFSQAIEKIIKNKIQNQHITDDYTLQLHNTNVMHKFYDLIENP